MSSFVLVALAALAASPSASSSPAASPQAPAASGLVGRQAPDFVLPSDRGGQVKLASFRGKQPVVLAFFPKAFTPG